MLFILTFLLAVSTCAKNSHALKTPPQYFYPEGLHVGSEPSASTSSGFAFSLNSIHSIATLDYGYEVAGYPVFNVSSVSGAVQIEVKYSEPFNGLSQPFSDGPFPFSVGLSNTFRVETFAINETGGVKAFLLQGGQRWQSINLITNGSVTFSQVGFEASITPIDVDSTPGSFKSDNELLNSIWKLGARAVSAACVEKGTQKAIWEISDDGALVRGMRPALSTQTKSFENYTMKFSSKVVRGGTGWAVAWPTGSITGGLQLNLISELPSETTFVNTNKTLTPPNSVILSSGYSIVNQTSLTSYNLDTFQVPFSVIEGEWYDITTTLSAGLYVGLSINNIKIFNVSLADYYVGATPVALQGSIGFGPYQDQVAYIKDVTVHDTEHGTLLYSNSMTDELVVLPEYGVHENYAAVCLDGAKRDRLVWLGDFYHTTDILASSTGRLDLARSTLQNYIDWQIPNGQFPISQPMGYPPSATEEFTTAGVYGLPDYQVLGLNAFNFYIQLSNDLDFARSSWPAIQRNIAWLTAQINNETGLVDFTYPFAFIGPAIGGSAVAALAVQGLNGAADVATAIGDFATASSYRGIASKIAEAVTQKLWNSSKGFYSLSLSDIDDFSVAGTAFAITSGIANTTQAQAALSAVSSQLALGPGFKDSSALNSSDRSINISPNTNGFLLSALMSTNSTSIATSLLSSLWGAMIADNGTNTGASWEYVNQKGEPGLDLFTSLSHPWGGAPTYLLTRWVAGIRQVEGVESFGYKKWIVQPGWKGYGVKSMQAKVPTPFGSLEVNWNITVVDDCEVLKTSIVAPEGTSGTFVLDGYESRIVGRNVRRKDGESMLELVGGMTHEITTFM